MRVNTSQSIKTAKSVHNRFGSWKAAKESSSFKDGKYVVRSMAMRGDQGASGTK
ncbi:hypothetical protein PX554_08060 [Sphingomonas sp. H39-1-10]|uniref:hypothetical protein n=1 Tax=Sphingomonas TaxID=13687 RepID=UPI000886C4C3|nr:MULTISPECIES: hypothetical protein [Sphingomonas]MDF0488083.1 hypothetical protein [Sphingomonas pollutisoli]SDA33340.1 hypothetical protein SAMN03159340_02887 [Sphingomonas sp. NFR15]